MCGIVGFNGFEQSRLEEAVRTLAHRGPDASGTYRRGSVGLGHTRLAIMDTSDRGAQPMGYTREGGAVHQSGQAAGPEPDSASDPAFGRNSDLVAVYNGEIYNFREIAAELQGRGYTFSSGCDTEVLLAAWTEWGESCVERFNGMWAFCIYDRRQECLYLSRDRMGQKPLYYYADEKRIAFASELKALFALGVPRSLDDEALRYYLFFGFPPRDRTVLRGVRKLEPGTVLSCPLDGQTPPARRAFWQLDFSAQPATQGEACDAVRESLAAAVKARAIADVPVGAFLSGGLDSSIITMLLRPHIADLKTFSVSFDHAEFDESGWARRVADSFETDHHEVRFSAGEVSNLIPVLFDSFDEPLGDPSMIPTYLVSRVAREQVTVCLSGMGGDELFAGYTRYPEFMLLDRLRHLPAALCGGLSRLYACRDRDRAGKLRMLLQAQSRFELYMRLFSHFYRGENEKVSPPGFDPLKPSFEHADPLTCLLDFDQMYYLPENGHMKEDRASMAHGLESRSPFMDPEVVRLANRLPSDLKLRGRGGKYVLKQAFKAELPPGVIGRRKQGFGVPLNHYFRNELADFARDNILGFSGVDYYDREVVSGLWDRHLAGTSDYSYLFWILLSFNLWHQRWLG